MLTSDIAIIDIKEYQIKYFKVIIEKKWTQAKFLRQRWMENHFK